MAEGNTEPGKKPIDPLGEDLRKQIGKALAEPRYPVGEEELKVFALETQIGEILLPNAELLEKFLNDVVTKLAQPTRDGEMVKYTGDKAEREGFLAALLGAKKYVGDLNSAVSRCKKLDARIKDVPFDEDEKRALAHNPTFLRGTVAQICKKTTIRNALGTGPHRAEEEEKLLIKDELQLVQRSLENFPLFKKLFEPRMPGKTGPGKS